METQSLECRGCGAPLPPARGQSVVRCTYCGRGAHVTSGHAELEGLPGATTLLDQLLRGPSGRRRGDGHRYGTREMRARDWRCVERGMWPVSARASSSFGGGWSAERLVGPPRVYPASGDRAGAWAPASRVTPVEWVEVEYPPGPPVAAVRVFETHVPGATFAVTVRGDDEEELVYEGPTEPGSREAQVLEVRLSPPRRVRAVRALVSNTVGASWTEIDTIGLVATDPLPLERRARPRSGRAGSIARTAGCAAASVAAIAATMMLALHPWGARTAPAPPTERVSGTVARAWAPERERMDAHGTVWASSVEDLSSHYADADPARYAGAQALGRPDVYPRHFDATRAWASQEEDQGPEWITVRFDEPVEAGAILVVETFHPGALARVDDLTEGRPPAVLWEGVTSTEDASRVLRLELASPRRIGALRLVLDTTRSRGWNEIDAVGLEPPRDTP